MEKICLKEYYMKIQLLEEIDERLLDYIIPSFSNLNEEVEILEDNTEEIEGLKYELQNLFDDKGYILETQFILRDEDVIKTINDLVKTVNKMKEGKEWWKE